MTTSDPVALPDEPAGRRTRLRRGGPRTPLPLLPLIAIAAGIGVAYVSQSAHSTQTTYRVTSLAAQQQQLSSRDQQLGSELARLESAERIVAAAQQLGMRPAGAWAYVAAKPVTVLPGSTQTGLASSRSNDPLQQLVADLSGQAGETETAP